MSCCKSCDEGGPCDCGCGGGGGNHNHSLVRGFDVGAGAGDFVDDLRTIGGVISTGNQANLCSLGYDWSSVVGSMPLHVGNWSVIPDITGKGSMTLQVLPSGFVVPDQNVASLAPIMMPDVDFNSYIAKAPDLSNLDSIIRGCNGEFWGKSGDPNTDIGLREMCMLAFGIKADNPMHPGAQYHLVRIPITYKAVGSDYVDDNGYPLLFADFTPLLGGVDLGYDSHGNQVQITPTVFSCPDGSIFGYMGPPTASGQDTPGFGPVPNPNYDPNQPASASNPPYIPGGGYGGAQAPYPSPYPQYPQYPATDPSIDPSTGMPWGYGQQPYYPPQYPPQYQPQYQPQYIDPSYGYAQPQYQPPMIPQMPFAQPMQGGGILSQLPFQMPQINLPMPEVLAPILSELPDPLGIIPQVFPEAGGIIFDDATGYYWDTSAGMYIDPTTGQYIDPGLLMHEQGSGVSGVGAALPSARTKQTLATPKVSAGSKILSLFKGAKSSKIDKKKSPVLWKRMARAARVQQLQRFRSGANSHMPAPNYKQAVAKKASQAILGKQAATPTAKTNLAAHLALSGNHQTANVLLQKAQAQTMAARTTMGPRGRNVANRSFGVSGDYSNAGAQSSYDPNAYGYQTPTPNMFAPVNDEGFEVDPMTGEVLPPF